MPASVVSLWFVRDTGKARLYTKIPPERSPTKTDEVWVPISITEGTTKHGTTPGSQHDVKLPDWFITQKNL